MLGPSFRVWAFPAPCNLTASIDTLVQLARVHLHTTDLDVCFLFVNRKRTRCRVLHFDGNGWGIYAKRLDDGYQFPALWEPTANPAAPGAALKLFALRLVRPVDSGAPSLDVCSRADGTDETQGKHGVTAWDGFLIAAS